MIQSNNNNLAKSMMALILKTLEEIDDINPNSSEEILQNHTANKDDHLKKLVDNDYTFIEI